MISGGSDSSGTTTEYLWNEPQWKLFKEQVYPWLDANRLTGEVAAYPGNMYTPELPAETDYLQRVPGLANELAAARVRMGQPAYEVTPEATERYYQESIKKPAMYEWETFTEPSIREAYVGPGYWGSARAQGIGQGAERLATTLGAQRADLYYKDEMARREAAEAAAGRVATAVPAAAELEAELTGTAGQYARMISQEQVLADLNRWLMGETVEGVTPEQYNPWYQLIMQALGLKTKAIGSESESTSFSLL